MIYISLYENYFSISTEIYSHNFCVFSSHHYQSLLHRVPSYRWHLFIRVWVQNYPSLSSNHYRMCDHISWWTVVWPDEIETALTDWLPCLHFWTIQRHSWICFSTDISQSLLDLFMCSNLATSICIRYVSRWRLGVQQLVLTGLHPVWVMTTRYSTWDAWQETYNWANKESSSWSTPGVQVAARARLQSSLGDVTAL